MNLLWPVSRPSRNMPARWQKPLASLVVRNYDGAASSDMIYRADDEIKHDHTF